MADNDNSDKAKENIVEEKKKKDSKSVITFPATITIIERRRRNRTFEHWYITIPVALRSIIEKKKKPLQVTLEKII